ncbi:MAG: hypothetical protein AB1714_03165 [Acidobacteriota bacterium]
MPALLLLWGGTGLLCAGGLARRLNLAELLSLSLMAGMGTVGVWGLLIMGAGLRFGILTASAILLAVGCFGIPQWRRRWRTRQRPHRLGPVAAVFAVLFTAAAVKPLLEVHWLPLLGWDSRITWGYKAKVILEEGTVRVPAFEDPYRVHLQPAYPVLVPIVQAYCAGFDVTRNDGDFKIPIALANLAAIMLLAGTLRRRTDSTAACFGGACLLGYLPAWASAIEVSLPEVVSGACNLAAAVLLARWFSERDSLVASWAVLFAAMSGLSKGEGMIFLFACVGLLLISAIRMGRVRPALSTGSLPIALALIGLAGWKSLELHLPVVCTMDYWGLFVSGQWSVSWAKLCLIAREYASAAVSPYSWGLLFPLYALALVRSTREQRLLGLVVLTYVAALVPAFVLSSWNPLDAHIRIAFPRILLQVAPIAALNVAEVCAAWFGPPQQPAG